VKFIAGRLCLDFVNTVGGRTETVLRDKLNEYSDLLRFAQLSGTLSPAGARRLARVAAEGADRAAAALTRAIAFREALYRIFKASLDGRRPSGPDLETLGMEVSTSRSHERLALAGGMYSWAWDDDAVPDRVLWPVARSAAELLTSEDMEKLRQCGGVECGWLFLDTSRNRSRRWCDMRDCGNRAKVRRFREKR